MKRNLQRLLFWVIYNTQSFIINTILTLIKDALEEVGNDRICKMITKGIIEEKSTEINLSNTLKQHQIGLVGEALKKNPNIEVLNLAENNLERYLRFQLDSKFNPKISVLNLSGNGLFNKSLKKVLGNLDPTNLKVLDLSNNCLKWKAAEFLRDWAETSSISLLDVSHNSIDSYGFGFLTTWILETPSIESLILNDNYMRDEGMEYLVDCLKMKPNITYVDISRNYIDGFSMKKFSKALTSPNFFVETLKLSINDRYKEDLFCCFFQAISNNKTIKKLVISGERERISLQDRQLEHLSNALLKNKTLREIEIHDAEITFESAMRMTSFLLLNKTLKGFSLCNCTFVNSEQESPEKNPKQLLFSALQGNKTLEKIIFSENKFTNEDLTFLCDVLSDNETLKYLDLSGNDFEEIQAKQILNKVAHIEKLVCKKTQANCIDLSTLISQITNAPCRN